MAVPFSRGIEAVLRRALTDHAFRAALLADRGAAADAAGIGLTESERAILGSVTETSLLEMLSRLPAVPVATPPTDHTPLTAGVRPDLPVKTIALAAGLALAGGALAATCLTAGNRPDVPPPRAVPEAPLAGSEGPADVAPDGVRRKE